MFWFHKDHEDGKAKSLYVSAPKLGSALLKEDFFLKLLLILGKGRTFRTPLY